MDILQGGTNNVLHVRNYVLREDYISTFILKFCTDETIIFRFPKKCACSSNFYLGIVLYGRVL
jgi:hypothetical protein